MKSYRFIFFGSSSFGLPALEALAADPQFTLVHIVTQPAKPTGRDRKLQPTAVGRWAHEHQVPVHENSTLRTPAVINELHDIPVDFYLVAAIGLILPPAILQLPARGCINIHASLLPAYRGASPIAAAIMAGETKSGVTFMLMDEGIDTGDTIQSHAVPITPTTTTPQLEHLLSQVAATHIRSAITDWLSGTRVPQKQVGPSSYAGKITKADGHATWDRAEDWSRKIRAYQPWPGVWAQWGDRQITIHQGASRPGQSTLPAGTIEQLPDGQWGIVCQDGWVVPELVQVSGRTIQPASTLPGSYPGFIGSRLS